MKKFVNFDMQISDLIRCIFLLLVLISIVLFPLSVLADDASAKSPATKSVNVLPTTISVESRLKDEDVQKIFKRYNSTHGKSIQEALFEIYQHDSIFIKEYENEKKLLRDNIVGKVTLSWIQKFCNEYYILASDPDFANQVVVSLIQVADITKQHPNWREILLSSDFENWINRQSSPKQIEIYKIRRSGAAPQVNSLIEEYSKTKSMGGKEKSQSGYGVNISFQLQPQLVQEQEHKEEIIKKLSSLIGPPYEDRRSFEAAITMALQGVDINLAANLLVIEENAKVVSYIWSPAAGSRLSVLGAPAELIDKLVPFFDEEYKNSDDFSARLDERLTDTDIQQSLKVFKVKIIENAQTIKFEITTESLERLADLSLPKVVLTMLKDLKGIDYPTESLLLKSIQWKMRNAIDTCPNNIYHHSRRLTNDEFKEFTAALKGKPNLIKELTVLRDEKLSCGELELARSESAITEVYKFFLPRLQSQMSFSKKHSNPAEPSKEIQWSVKSCSCLLDTLSGQVYGFYPFWLDPSKQQINFGLLSRIGLYGVTFDDSGNLDRSSVDAPIWPSALIDAAHRYGTQVDWVVHKNDWTAWSKKSSAEEKKLILDNLTKNIISMLTNSNFDTPLTGKAKKDLPLADGVTIYFDQFPDGDIEIINYFFEDLAKKLNALKPRKRMNIMASHEAMSKPGRVPFSYLNLSDRVIKTNVIAKVNNEAERVKAQPLDIHIIVLLEEPTTDSKKALRSEIEKALHGEDRVRILRDIIPVIEFDGVSWPQLEDDIIYFDDNFGGIGFWPLPTRQGAVQEKDSIDNLLIDRYLEKDTELQSAVCGVVCPNRVVFRGSFIGSLLFVSIMCIVYLRCCSCRNRLQAKGYTALFIVFALIPLILFVLLMFCDPIVKQLSAPYISLIFVFFVIVSYAVWNYYNINAKKEKP